MLINILQEINESRFEKGQGSKAGREKFSSKKGIESTSVKAKKSRVKIYNSIKDALNGGAPYGTIFSTKTADRLYVITKPTWGDKSRAGGNTRVAKGFTPGSATPSANWPSIKAHAVRTMIKHGKTKSTRLTQKYGPGKSRPEEKRFSGKPTTPNPAPKKGTDQRAALVDVLGKKGKVKESNSSLIERRVVKMQRLRESTSPQNWELFCEQLETLHEVAITLAKIASGGAALIGKGAALAAKVGAAAGGLAAKGAGVAAQGAGAAVRGAGAAVRGAGTAVRGAGTLASRGAQAVTRGAQTVGRGVGQTARTVAQKVRTVRSVGQKIKSVRDVGKKIQTVRKTLFPGKKGSNGAGERVKKGIEGVGDVIDKQQADTEVHS